MAHHLTRTSGNDLFLLVGWSGESSPNLQSNEVPRTYAVLHFQSLDAGATEPPQPPAW
jgi:hypothetical protein